MTKRIINTKADIEQLYADSMDCGKSAFATLTMQQKLKSAEGDEAPVFPPSYAPPKGEEGSRYDISVMPDGTKQVQFDSVGSQGNRMEPVFKEDGYRDLVPQNSVNFNGEEVSLLDMPHRVADATVKSAPKLGDETTKAIQKWKTEGNCRDLVNIAPTSIVFGFWDGRDTGKKANRLVRSFIRANNVEPVTMSAQYFSVPGKLHDGTLRENLKEISKDQKKLANAGLDDVPAFQNPGGVHVFGDITRTLTVNLNGIRKLAGGDAAETEQIRKYLFALSLIAATHDIDLDLRQGCHLKIDSEEWVLVPRRGANISVEFGDDFDNSLLEFAREAAAPFKVSFVEISDEFSLDKAKELVAKKAENEGK